MLVVDVQVRVGNLALDIQLEADRGTTVVVGPNGAGKSSLLKCILGVVTPASGTITLDGEQVLCTKTGVDVPIEERALGYVPQSYGLFPHMTALQNVAFGIRGRDRVARDRRARDLLAAFDLADVADRKATQLSGGESQRVALARALATGPRVMLLDEPMAALDAVTRRSVRHVLAEELRAAAVPTLVVTHDVVDAEVLADRVAVLEAGRVVQVGTLDELRACPASDFVRALVCPDDPPAPRSGWRPDRASA